MFVKSERNGKIVDIVGAIKNSHKNNEIRNNTATDSWKL